MENRYFELESPENQFSGALFARNVDFYSDSMIGPSEQ